MVLVVQHECLLLLSGVSKGINTDKDYSLSGTRDAPYQERDKLIIGNEINTTINATPYHPFDKMSHLLQVKKFNIASYSSPKNG